MKKVLPVLILFSASILIAQKSNSYFSQFKNNLFSKNFKPLFTISAPLLRTEYNFKLSTPERKPIFCRMEDKLCNKFNIWLQLRAGSDEEYRKMAFPKYIINRE